jgi:hypothetical protein
MTKRSFIKAALSTPLVSLANTVIPVNRNFVFHGDGDTSFKGKNYIVDKAGKPTPNRILCIGSHFSQDQSVKIEKFVFGTQQDPSKYSLLDSEWFPDSDPNYPPSPTTTMLLSSARWNGLPFLLAKDYRSLTDEERNHYNEQSDDQYIAIYGSSQKIKVPSHKIDVYTDFPSFKHMMDTKYKGDYTQEFLDDIKRLHF